MQGVGELSKGAAYMQQLKEQGNNIMWERLQEGAAGVVNIIYNWLGLYQPIQNATDETAGHFDNVKSLTGGINTDLAAVPALINAWLSPLTHVKTNIDDMALDMLAIHANWADLRDKTVIVTIIQKVIQEGNTVVGFASNGQPIVDSGGIKHQTANGVSGTVDTTTTTTKNANGGSFYHP